MQPTSHDRLCMSRKMKIHRRKIIRHQDSPQCSTAKTYKQKQIAYLILTVLYLKISRSNISIIVYVKYIF